MQTHVAIVIFRYVSFQFFYYQIYEGHDEKGTSKHSAEETPSKDVTAESGELFIKFSTDATENGNGFSAEYSIGKYQQSIHVRIVVILYHYVCLSLSSQ